MKLAAKIVNWIMIVFIVFGSFSAVNSSDGNAFIGLLMFAGAIILNLVVLYKKE